LLAQILEKFNMPEKETLEKARRDASEGKSPSTQAGEFVHEEIEHVKEGRHGARSAKQAIAIGLSKARRAGVKLPPPKAGASEKTKQQAQHDSEKGQSEPDHKPSRTRSRATTKALQAEGHSAASHQALSQQARSSARHRSAANRKEAAAKAVQTKGKEGLSNAGKKAARTRARKG
jgi:hypothetical protein